MKRRTLWLNLGLGVGIVVVAALILTALRPGQQAGDERTVTVVRGDITATVTASGTVERAGTVELAFSSPGTVTSVDVQPGDRVTAGQVLASVDDAAALQQVATAESTLAQAVQSAAASGASVASASAALASARRVAAQSNEHNELAVRQARESLAVAQGLWDESCLDPRSTSCPNPAAAAQLRAAEANVDSARRASDSSVENAANNAIGYDVAVNQAGEILTLRRNDETTACEGAGSGTTACSSARAATIAARQAYDTAVRARTTGQLIDQQTQQTASLSLASANVALQRTQAELRKAGVDAVRSARQALDTAERIAKQGRAAGEQSIQAAESALRSAQAAEQTVDIPGEGALTAAEAGIAAAEAGLQAAQRALRDTRLVSPMAGVVGQVPYVVGEIAAPTATAGGITIIPEGPLEVVADFAESDAAAIAAGAPATVTFDALAGTSAQGVVVFVDPVATTSTTGLVTYGVRVQVSDPPVSVREGMTASVAVVVDEVSDVLVVPQGAITGSGERASVLVRGADGTAVSTPVTVGLQGDNGTEILGGVAEGDVLVIPSADDLSFPEGGVPGSGRDSDPDGPFGGDE